MFSTSLVAQTVKNLPEMQKSWVWSLGGKDSLEQGMATRLSTLAWNPMVRGAWRATVHGVSESQTEWLSVWEWLSHFHTHVIVNLDTMLQQISRTYSSDLAETWCILGNSSSIYSYPQPLVTTILLSDAMHVTILDF